MQNFDIIREVNPTQSFRVASVMGHYDIQSTHITERFTGKIDLPEKWKIGLIVGNSGTGKTTIAKELFGTNVITAFDYTHDNILDDMPSNASVNDITMALSSVGFASPTSWLKPYAVLSNGEKMRCDLARALLEQREMVVFDEFTSVVDRNVAKISSLAIHKFINRGGVKMKFVAVSCHEDITEWLMPDWIFDTNTMTFSSNLENQKKKPDIRLEIFEIKNANAKRKYWQIFRKYHYLNTELNVAARVYVCFANEKIAAFSSWITFPHPTLKNALREHRTVVLPDYQGVGIATAFRDELAKRLNSEGKIILTTTSNIAMIMAMKKNPKWKCTRIGRVSSGSGILHNKKNTHNFSVNRITCAFRYIG